MAKIKKVRQEMWWVILAKSKTLRFFAVSCEFILFLGGLWITFTVNDPSAKMWLGGNVNMLFLTVMGWAIDAAMPEAWLHVVIQHVQKEKGQMGWSKFVACCISVLFIGNIVYSIFTSGDTSKSTGAPTDATAWILLFLTILRITVGFVYLTVRQCQEWIKRQSEPIDPPAQQLPDYWPLVAMAAHLQSQFEMKLTELASNQQTALVGLVNEQRLAECFDVQVHKFNLVDLQMQRLLAEVQAIDTSVETVDYAVLTEAVLTRLQGRLEVFLNERVSVSPVIETPQISAPQRVSESVSKQSETLNPLALKQPRRPTKTNDSELVRRSRKVSDEEVDAVVHPILNKDQTLTHRKIAPVIGLPETTVYKSLKRWRDTQPVVSGNSETADSDTAI